MNPDRETSMANSWISEPTWEDGSANTSALRITNESGLFIYIYIHIYRLFGMIYY